MRSENVSQSIFFENRHFVYILRYGHIRVILDYFRFRFCDRRCARSLWVSQIGISHFVKGTVKYSYVFSVYYSGYAILPVSTGYRTAVLNMKLAIFNDVNSVSEK